MIVVIGQFRLPPGAMTAGRIAMTKVIEATRREDGCVQYNYAEDMIDPGLIRVSEIWESEAQLSAHLQTPHMAVWQKERAALGLSERDITVFTAGPGKPL
ncbi:putative quinol monooxygenase [Novosphingobium sp.]|uniref:putative quinol monooxygenase n=1 Tax=Novosphingobium sp. TaxID=1874826 RepID=UPI0025EBF885|nr:putative quinol monooxygenase [Novosphingobium sp.]